MHGYSGTPLARKLGIKEGFYLHIVFPPVNYLSLFSDFPSNITMVDQPEAGSIDLIHLFSKSKAILQHTAPQLKAYLKIDGMIWVSWPKGTSKLETDLQREWVREFMLKETGLVDVKVAAVDSNWSGLKFVYRLRDRG